MGNRLGFPLGILEDFWGFLCGITVGQQLGFPLGILEHFHLGITAGHYSVFPLG